MVWFIRKKNLLLGNESSKKSVGQELCSEIPGMGFVFTFFKAIQTYRLEQFFSRLKDAIKKEDKQFFEELNSKSEAAQILYDYAESVRKTNSTWAINALALLYAEYYQSDKSADEFLKIACRALSEITNEVLKLFIIVSDIETLRKKGYVKEKEEIYPIVFFENNIFEYIKNEYGSDLNEEYVVSRINQLIKREMILPDYAVGRYGGVDCPFGIGEETLRFRELLLKAKDLHA